ncbi:MAG TPA: Rpn family recombination-promoting nuclease/putative transposase, partial [Myxococcota bacterium]|nr:Rpn family recombination-promoting nuclease/putative transposase [Myxococcota bacterium]
MHRRGPFHIDPTVDCVIHTLLGDPRRSHILLDFLNAVVAPELRFESVTILNPVQNPEFIGDTQHVLDVEAVDQTGRIIQVEMQSHNAHALKARILYNWADLYDRQLKGGTHWSELRPVVCIWILGDNIFRDAPRVHHHFMVHDPGAGLTLGDHLHIHTLELPKWVRRLGPAPEPALLRWLRFFTEAEDWEDVPVELQSPILEEAMGILETFAENASWNSAYRRRMNWEVSQRTEQLARREAEAARDAA